MQSTHTCTFMHMHICRCKAVIDTLVFFMCVACCFSEFIDLLLLRLTVDAKEDAYMNSTQSNAGYVSL